MHLLLLCMQVVLTVMMNIVSTALAVTSIVLYSVDLAQTPYRYWCRMPKQQENYYVWTTASPVKKAKLEEIYQQRLENYRVCVENELMLKVISSNDVEFIILFVPQVFNFLHLEYPHEPGHHDARYRCSSLLRHHQLVCPERKGTAQEESRWTGRSNPLTIAGAEKRLLTLEHTA